MYHKFKRRCVNAGFFASASTKEEKEAILTLDTLALNGLSVTITEDIQKDIQIVLNLVQKLQKENEEKDKIIDLMAKTWKQDDVRSIEEIKQYFEKQAKEV